MRQTIGGFSTHQLVRRLFAILLMSNFAAVAEDTIPADANEPAIAEPYQSLRAELLEIKENDRGPRLQMEELQKAGIPPSSAQAQELMRKLESNDIDCLARVKIILAENGWLGPEQVGKKASETLFFVIQHADAATQQEYMPVIRQAVKDKKLRAKLLPLFEDRLALDNGRKQIYGTQIGTSRKIAGYYISPLEDPDNVDKRRAEVGLEPIAEYVKRWGITWDVEVYKKQLPELEVVEKSKIHPKPPEIPEQNKLLRAELLSIKETDQKYRKQINDCTKKFGDGSNELKLLWDKIKATDEENTSKITAILDKHGWLGPNDVGPNASLAMFLVIQHSELVIQQKYLPTMRSAVKDGKARPAELALLEDRVALREGRCQIYGSQLGFDIVTKTNFVRPLENPDDVDKRRAEVGLEPLSSYAIQWGIVWDVDAYKKQLPEIEEFEKKLREEQSKK